MTQEVLARGTVDYTGRAFHQDASEAMRGDIVRGLIEAITNADDAYASMETSARDGKILLEVEHRRSQPWVVRVRDRATGIDDLVGKIARLGGRTSGFELGHERRGNLGRGAKDLAAFGDVTFFTIHNEQYSELKLYQDGTWELRAKRPATPSDRNKLGIRPSNGTVVEIHVQENIRCPHHETLKRKLSSNWALRDILSDPSRKVELTNLNDNTREILVYSYPNLAASTVFDSTITFPGYEDVPGQLRIWRLYERSPEGPESPERQSGILVKGTRAIYENTLFRFEGDVHAASFGGGLSCAYIDQLARDYDDRLESNLPHDPKNPEPIISRRRDGLNRHHPFYEAIRAAVEEPLGRLVAAEAERARREAGHIESASTRQALDRLAREVSRVVDEELRDIEAEELPPSDLTGMSPLLSIVPEQAYAYMGEDRTLSVAARNEGIAIGVEVTIELDPVGVVDLLTPIVQLGPHRRREDILMGQLRLRPLLEDDVTMITARLDDRIAHALLEVRPEREIIEVEVELPSTFQFERPSYRVGWQRTKKLELKAPAQVVSTHGQLVSVSSSDPGVVVLTPHIELHFDDSLDHYRSFVEIEARTLGATARITASLDDQIATTHVAVSRQEEAPGLEFRLVDESFGYWRTFLDTETRAGGSERKVVKIAGKHPAIRYLIGDDGSDQDTPAFRAILAELAADFAARMIVQELYRLRRTMEDFDADRVYREHNRRVSKFLPRFQRIMMNAPIASLITA